MSVLLTALALFAKLVAALLASAGALLLWAPTWLVARMQVLAAEAEATGSPGISLERGFYRHHRALGLFVVLGAIYILYFLVFAYSPPAVQALLLAGIADSISRAILEQLLQILLFFGALLAYTVGILLAIRPSALKPLEQLVNRPVRIPGWQRLLSQVLYGRMIGAALLVLAVCLWWLA